MLLSKQFFPTKDMDRVKRFTAWQEAMCEHYLNVDVYSDKPASYTGFWKNQLLVRPC